MIISCIGDSLTEGDYGIKGKRGIANVQEKNYPYFLQKILGGEVRNFGKCGYTATNYLQYYQSGEVDVSNSNAIIVMLGTNGGLSSIDDNATGNLHYLQLLNLLQKDAPNAKIYLCTPPHATTNTQMSNCGYAQRVAEAVSFVNKLANNYAIIDVANCSDFCDETEHLMQPNDGLHFGEMGYQRLAQFIAKHIK